MVGLLGFGVVMVFSSSAIEATVFPVDGVRQAPISPIDGRPMRRADAQAVRELLEDLQRTTENHILVEELAPTVTVFGDRERIGQVLTNLITNAIKYSPKPGKIIIGSTVVGKEIQLWVKDFGIGIPRGNLSRVFEQFYRVSGDMQHTFPGLGLGLYITAEIIKRQNGRIWVTSQEGEGSVFCFSLPLVRETI